ncbi:MAG: hypothetical protein ACOZCL_10010 [Bacillota bacterium]
MRNLAPNEILSLSKMLQMEANSLAIAKAAVNVVTDEKLRSLTQSGINAMENRIRGIQQFVNENQLTVDYEFNTNREGVQ